MQQPLIIRDICIGSGRPKTIVPIVAPTTSEILTQAKALQSLALDCVEWRADLWQGARDAVDFDALRALLPQLRAALGGKLLLVTYRRNIEGGAGCASDADYIAFCKAAAHSPDVDLVDIELSIGHDTTTALIDFAHAHSTYTITSSHNFTRTPTQQEMTLTLYKMRACGTDIAKIAVMPQSKADVLALLGATAEMTDTYPDTPVITMSMGALGQVSRLCGGTFGSAMTFASVGNCSAPGQIALDTMNLALDALYTQDTL